ncbi:hypothetical protein N7448_008917 [Penicillium atrosanguineum]|uniref:Uncharacterized protein n=1 Tax=Penicillium atrosanguineum TaxID=1132637 RepID=A0A9W9GS62_9EURO|nr:uncharacterized protein N7443_000054 [Penicillium atrosanguineum]KAJ5128138.1 hypothetical protein N7448_008917 [Penicillium atrosanguineum]KAJ5313170.1 hypothetical protein N7443_000054 [Penicillium atrosanguineum]KAJ5330275.1 hypothetical protein N7476_000058 [Penicillium atrosanguineum]
MSSGNVNLIEGKKRPALEQAGGIQKKPMTNPNTNPQEMRDTQIAYHSSVEDKENPLDACVNKMVREAPSLRYDAEQRIAANEGGFGLLAELREMNDKINRLESHRQGHLDIRQRAISTWVRDALSKDTERRKEDIRRLNKDIIHGGDVRSDAMVVIERYKKSSTEWQYFRTLYGLTPDNVNDLDQQKCYRSLQALDRAASILLKNAWTSLPTEAMGKEREDLVAMLLVERYEESEKMSSTFIGGNESSVAEEYF